MTLVVPTPKVLIRNLEPEKLAGLVDIGMQEFDKNEAKFEEISMT